MLTPRYLTGVCVALAALLANVSAAHAVDYWVATTGSDTAAGTQAAPFRTITKAITVVTAGSTVHVKPGTYTGLYSSAKNGTSTARIRYVCDTKWSCKLVPPTNAAPSSGTPLWRQEGNFVDIEGFNVDGTAAPKLCFGIEHSGDPSGGQHGRTINNHVHHFACQGGSGGAGILHAAGNNGSYLGTGGDAFGNFVHHIGNIANTTANLRHGIYMSNPVGKVYNNTVCLIEGAGIHLWHGPRNIDIYNNLVINSNRGIVVGAGDGPWNGDPAHPADFVRVYNNIFVGNKNIGYESGETGANNVWSHTLAHLNTDNSFDLQSGAEAARINANPLFVSYAAGVCGGDYHLTASSPAINSASNVLLPPVDIDGIARPQGASGDRGPYEFAGGTPPPPPPPPPPPGLVPDLVWLKLDETSGTVATNSASATHGTVVGTPNWVVGKIGNGFRFDGLAKRIKLANTSALSLATSAKSAWTVMAWVKPATYSGTPYPTIYSYGEWTASLGLTVATAGTDGRIEFSQNNASFPVGVAAVPVAAWRHVAIVRNGSTAKFFVNGVLDATRSTVSINTGSGGSAVGGTPAGSLDGGFNGVVDDVRLYGRALTNSEVQQVFSGASSSAAALSVPEDTEPPGITVLAPVDGTMVSRGSTVTIEADAADAVGVTSVEFRVNSQLIKTDTEAPYTASWDAPNTRSVLINVLATAADAAGNSAEDSASISTR